jgi:hypothetical protein
VCIRLVASRIFFAFHSRVLVALLSVSCVPCAVRGPSASVCPSRSRLSRRVAPRDPP